MSKRAFWTTLFLIFLIVSLVPIVTMIYENLYPLPYLHIWTNSVFKTFTNSLLLSMLVATVTTIAGTILGFIFAKTDFRYTEIFLTLLIIPLLLPSFIVAFGWVELIGVKGFLSSLLFGFWGTFFVLFSIYLPIPILFCIYFLKQINPQYEEAARLITDEKNVLKVIILPMIRPALVLSFLLVFILSFGEFGVANVLRYKVFALESFTQFSAFYDFKAGTVLAMPIIVVILLAISIEQFYIKKDLFRYKVVQNPYIIKLTKKEQLKILLSLGTIIFVIVFLPLLKLFSDIGTLKHFIQTFQNAFDPLIRSILYSLVGAFILMIFGFLYAYFLEQKMRFSSFLDASMLFIFALPTTVLGISLIGFYNKSYTEFIYATPLIILFGYFGKYIILTTKMAQTKLSTIPNSLTLAAQMSGANWFETLIFITLPLSKKTLLSMFLIGFIFVLRENSLTTMLYPAGYETLPIHIITQMANAKAETIAALCTIMIDIIIVPLLLLLTIRRYHDRV